MMSFFKYILLLISFSVFSQDEVKKPSVHVMYSDSDNPSWMTLRCNERQDSVVCSSYKINLESKGENVKPIIEQLKDPEQASSEFINKWAAQGCKNSKNRAGIYPQDVEEKFIKLGSALCNDDSHDVKKNNLLKFLNAADEISEQRCKMNIPLYPNIVEFTFKGEYWVSNDGPDGECGLLTITTLKNNESDWVYSEKELMLNKDASPSCSSFEESEKKYVTRSSSKIKFMNCKYFD